MSGWNLPDDAAECRGCGALIRWGGRYCAFCATFRQPRDERGRFKKYVGPCRDCGGHGTLVSITVVQDDGFVVAYGCNRDDPAAEHRPCSRCHGTGREGLVAA